MIAVIGGGAAGMMAAGIAACLGKNVSLFERNAVLGKKILITGKGRCNLTNDCTVPEFISRIPRNGKFLYAALSKFDSAALVSFFTNLGVGVKVERGRRVFPESDSAIQVRDALKRFAESNGVSLFYGERVSEVLTDGARVCGVRLGSGKCVDASSVILATGGLSYPGTGSQGDGYDIAARLGHKINPPVPALVPLVTVENWVKDIEGLALRNVCVSLYSSGKLRAAEFGEMLFTDYGVSGPVILTLGSTASELIAAGRAVSIGIDLKPALSDEQLDSRLQRDLTKFAKKILRNGLVELLPKSMIPVVIANAGLSAEKPCNQITREERERLLKTLKGLELHISGTRGFDEAIVTRGGVDVEEINPSTMESRIVQGLYFSGELIDVDGFTGGFNLQIAFSTGYLAGLSCR